ncbi:MAG: RNA methyltransferase [Rickettsiaceae bacterium]|nr:RNA methyltransferase [Rickettsiaceae bacterium]
MNLNEIAIILVAPQMGENIGASARAMKNFGLTDLRIVKPRDGWPNEKALNVAASADNIINSATIYSNLKEATYDLEYLYATTASKRDINKEQIFSNDLKRDIKPNPQVKKLGFIFGRENNGLTNEEISFANKIITINTADEYSSLNLAHAVSIICHKLFIITTSQSEVKSVNKAENCKTPLAKKKDLEYFYDNLFTKLEQKSFFKASQKQDLMEQKIRNIFGRINNLSQSEVQILQGIIKTLDKNKK